jgi:hypothetical protein
MTEKKTPRLPSEGRGRWFESVGCTKRLPQSVDIRSLFDVGLMPVPHRFPQYIWEAPECFR